MHSNEINELYLHNDGLKSNYKELKHELHKLRNIFLHEKDRMNRQMLEILHVSKNKKNESNDNYNEELLNKNAMLEHSIKSIADKYVLIEKKVWKEQFNGNVSNINLLLEKICNLEGNIKVLENEILEKELFFNNELSLLK